MLAKEVNYFKPPQRLRLIAVTYYYKPLNLLMLADAESANAICGYAKSVEAACGTWQGPYECWLAIGHIEPFREFVLNGTTSGFR